MTEHLKDELKSFKAGSGWLNMGRWFEDESFWEEFKQILFSEERIKKTPYQVDRFIELLDLKRGDKILDQCSGIGRHSLELARRGYEVTGVDITGKYLKEAREKAENEGLNIEFVQADIRDFKRDNFYDACINFYTSFGYSEDEDENIKAIENVHSSLKPKGKFLLDVMGKEVLDEIYTDEDLWRLDDGYFLEKRKIRDDLDMLESKWKFIKDNGEVKEHKFMYKLYTEEEIRKLLKEVGFEEINIYGDLDGSRYGKQASRLIAVAQKQI
ncbi:MAG: class I SAM-dependent methyltransferase [Candidatus Thermoplasmatota archaeon]|nr:class I SAM-dependent methyltransferase [Candidatus Thermoplasmatota archaeon]MBS3789302.1 class I SAM-dependent methyltransferase [Candidatus Thermoplasmatota archaeon]